MFIPFKNLIIYFIVLLVIDSFLGLFLGYIISSSLPFPSLANIHRSSFLSLFNLKIRSLIWALVGSTRAGSTKVSNGGKSSSLVAEDEELSPQLLAVASPSGILTGGFSTAGVWVGVVLPVLKFGSNESLITTIGLLPKEVELSIIAPEAVLVTELVVPSPPPLWK